MWYLIGEKEFRYDYDVMLMIYALILLLPNGDVELVYKKSCKF